MNRKYLAAIGQFSIQLLKGKFIDQFLSWFETKYLRKIQLCLSGDRNFRVIEYNTSFAGDSSRPIWRNRQINLAL